MTAPEHEVSPETAPSHEQSPPPDAVAPGGLAGAVGSSTLPATVHDRPAVASPATGSAADSADATAPAESDSGPAESPAPPQAAKPAVPATPLRGALGHGLTHAIVAAGLVFLLIGIAPRFERVFRDAGLKVPPPTDLVRRTSYLLRDYWYVAPLVLLADLGLLWSLRRYGGAEGPLWCRRYSIGVIIAGLAAAGAIGLALFGPMLELVRRLN